MVADAESEDKRPASRRVADDLARRIDAGEYPPGGSLPTLRQLAADYDVAANTAHNAIRVLRDRGLVTIRRNAGARVLDQSETPDLAVELDTARTEVTTLRSQIQDVNTRLAELEARLGALSDRLGADEY